MEFFTYVIDSLSACCLNCREEDTRSGEPTERTSLLQQEQRIPNIRDVYSEIDEEDVYHSSSLPTSENRNRDEQTALNKIVQETNS